MSSSTTCTLDSFETSHTEKIVGVPKMPGRREVIQDANQPGLKEDPDKCSWPPKRSRRKTVSYFPTKPSPSSLSTDADLIAAMVFQRFSSEGKNVNGESEEQKVANEPKPPVTNERLSTGLLTIGLVLVLLVVLGYISYRNYG